MHISDGVLNGEITIGTFILMGLIIFYSSKKINREYIPKISLMTAAFFSISLIHIPVLFTSTHLILNGVIGIILGFSSFPAIMIALFFQSIMFGHGGITAIGANTILMGIPAIISYLIYLSSKNRSITTQKIYLFFIGFTSIMISSIILFIFLYLSGKEFYKTAQLVVFINIPLAIAEGFITLFIITFIKKIKPEMLE
jgi:cobalt/nickel transport system permease protein